MSLIIRLVALFILCTWAAAEPIPPPDFNRVDYAHPDRYLAIEPTLGSSSNIHKIASALSGKTPRGSLISIHRWIGAHLRDTHGLPYRWRTFDEIVKDGTTNENCADVALVFGALARAVGIPTIWVKTMDVDWIRDFVRNPGHPSDWRGHVFLELLLDGKWRLLDPSASILHEDYSPRAHVLPGNRWAYDKGGDPFTLILSSRGEVWNRQTAAFFRSFDVSQLPVGEGRPLERTVHIVADETVGKWVQARTNALGLQTASIFTNNYPKWLKAARGNWLIVIAIGDTMTLPKGYREEYSPASAEQIRKHLAQRPSGRFDRHLEDGTIVVLLCGRDLTGLQQEIAHLTLDADVR